MLRTLFLFLGIVALAMGAAWLADNPGRISVDWLGYRIDTHLTLALVLLGTALFALWMTWRFVRWIVYGPAAIAQQVRGWRERRSFETLSRGLIAVAGGDAEGARLALADLPSKALDPSLRLLLQAQAAQLGGDEEAAEEAFHAMLDDERLAFLGHRGLHVLARRRDDEAAAETHAEAAAAMKPRAAWAQTALMDLAVRRGAWLKARGHVQALANENGLPGDLARRREVVLLTAEALENEATGDMDDALALAEQAITLVPGFVPAVAIAGRRLLARGKTWKTAGLIEEAWKSAPHPDLAALYAQIKPSESAERRLARFNGLFELNRDHAESRIHFSQLAVACGKWLAARDALGPIAMEAPTAHICELMAEVAEGEGETDEAREWRAKAARAPRDAGWGCGACGTLHTEWSALCPQCGAFDTYDWRLPDAAGWTPRQRIDGDLERAGDLAAAIEEEGSGFFSQLARMFGGGAPAAATPAADADAPPDLVADEEPDTAMEEDAQADRETLEAEPVPGDEAEIVTVEAEPQRLALPAASPPEPPAPPKPANTEAANQEPAPEPVPPRPDEPAAEEGASREDAARLVG